MMDRTIGDIVCIDSNMNISKVVVANLLVGLLLVEYIGVKTLQ